jgi:hypothetical protein
MSESVFVQCPHCNAQGNLADPALFGQAISCPVCQQTFVAPMPGGLVPPVATVHPVPAEINPPGPAPTAAAVAGPTTAVPVAETMTAGVPTPVELPPPSVDIPAPMAGSAPFAVQDAAGLDVATASVAAATVVPAGVAETGFAILPTDIAAPTAQSPAAATTPTMTPAMTPVPHEYAAGAAPVPQAPASVPQVPVAGTWPVGTAPAEAPFAVTGDFLVPERPAMEGPTPAFMAPLPPPGAAEVGFAASLPEPEARGAVRPHKPPSKTMMRVAIGSVSAILLVATVLFLMGDPLRGKKPKLKKPVQEAPVAGKQESIEDVFQRINASSKSNDK